MVVEDAVHGMNAAGTDVTFKGREEGDQDVDPIVGALLEKVKKNWLIEVARIFTIFIKDSLCPLSSLIFPPGKSITLQKEKRNHCVKLPYQTSQALYWKIATSKLRTYATFFFTL